ncbi:MAG TPA: hypothetical protein VF406_00140 [Thermodesulfobacteriota bacterium]
MPRKPSHQDRLVAAEASNVVSLIQQKNPHLRYPRGFLDEVESIARSFMTRLYARAYRRGYDRGRRHA